MRATTPGEKIHSDICGPFEVQTPSSHKYFVSFLDDATGFATVYLIKTKAEVFSKFVVFYKMLKTQFDYQIKSLRADGGGEYTSNQMKSFLQTNGMVLDLSPPYTPQLNGRAEVFNRTVVNMARTMLSRAGMSSTYWGECILTACYLINRVVRRSSISQLPPYQAFTGERVNAANLRVFGCACYARVPSSLRTKLQAKAIRCVFLGYDNDKNGYRLLSIKSRRVIITRDAVFDESQFPACRNQEATVEKQLQLISGPQFDLEHPEELQQGDDADDNNGGDHNNDDNQEHKHDGDQPETIPVGDSEHSQDESDEKSGLSSCGVESKLDAHTECSGPRRTTRTRRQRLSDYPMLAHTAATEDDEFAFNVRDSHESPTYTQAMKSPDREGWIAAINEEKQAMLDHKVWK